MTRGEVQDKIYELAAEFPNDPSIEICSKLGEWLDSLDLSSENFSQAFMKAQILADFGSYALVEDSGIVEELPE